MRTPIHAVLAAALLGVAAIAAGCQSKADKTGLASRGFYSPDFDTVWEVGEREMVKAGFTPDRDASSKETRTMVSRWSNSLMPFANKGYRQQATVYFHEVEGQANRWTVEANVIRETNTNITQPSNPIVAKWEDPIRVPEKERALVGRIEMFFLPQGVSPEFRSRYGLPASRDGSTDGLRPAEATTDAPRPR